MSILSGFKKFKDYIKTDSGYQLMSRWTKSDAVIMGDGTDDTNTLEKNCGAIKGITSSLTSTSGNIAASASAVKTVNDKLSGLTFAQDEKGNWGYIPSGADSVVPFSNIENVIQNLVIENVTKKGSCWGSTGTLDTDAIYTVSRDGIILLNGSCENVKTANQNQASGISQYYMVYLNDEIIYNSDNGDDVHRTTLTIDANEGDTITFRYRIKYANGDSMYRDTVVSVAVVAP